MTSYALTEDAEEDLKEIARYTLNKWGKEKLDEYRGGLDKTFQEIGGGKINKKPFPTKHPKLRVSEYKFHYIFYLVKGLKKKPLIIA